MDDPLVAPTADASVSAEERQLQLDFHALLADYVVGRRRVEGHPDAEQRCVCVCVWACACVCVRVVGCECVCGGGDLVVWSVVGGWVCFVGQMIR
jgi:hypothetical protein